MISVFVNNAGPYILVADKTGDGFTTFVSPTNRSPVLAMDLATGMALREQFADLAGDTARFPAADDLIDVTRTGMSADVPGIGRLSEIQRFQGTFILVAADHDASLHVTGTEVVAIFRGIERLAPGS